MSPLEPSKARFIPSPCALQTFIACAHQMLDPATPEPVLCKMEPKLLAQLPALRALGVFELFELRDPAMRAWLSDELAKLATSASTLRIHEAREYTELPLALEHP